MRFEIPIYGGSVEILPTDPAKAIRKAIKIGCNPEETAREISDVSEACAFRAGEGDYAVWFRIKPSAGVVAHEALHITNYIMSDIGVSFSYCEDEAAAYLIEYLVEKIWTMTR